MQSEFDVIVVGAGPAGSAAALSLTRRGVSVLMLEKGKVPGEKSMTGGVLYGDFPGGQGIRSLVPDFDSSAPLERQIISHEVVVLGAPDEEKGTAQFYRMTKTSLAGKLGLFSASIETGHDFSVLSRPFDSWFADLAVKEGATLSTSTTAVGLIKEDGVVAGVMTTHESLRSKVVIDSSGVTSTLVEEAGLRKTLSPRQLYHGIKRVYGLDPGVIERRFRVGAGKGRAAFYLGGFMQGIGGGAFVYTNKETLSVGLVVELDSLVRATTEHFDRVGKLIDVQDEFEGHPMVAELLDGATLLEYSAHNTPKSFKSILKKPYADGYLVAGDALGSFVKMGPMVDGMRGAIASGIMAAEAFARANSSGSFRARNLSRYREMLGPIYDDVGRSGRDSFISESSFTYHTLPRVIFGTRLISETFNFVPRARPSTHQNTIQRVSAGLNLLSFDLDGERQQIKVDTNLASMSITKPWVPTCPANCFVLQTSKGEFASFRDLYEHNLRLLSTGTNPPPSIRRKAFSETKRDVAEGRLRFDHSSCVSCGTCGSIGPAELVEFAHEEDGHGVRYKFG
ncbi:MAG: FAD-dependent oxidoreductase [Thaumarchaeota archaeon]|nr:FAD-dependent oxidoreductase [Nitrososphaerota archaeon]